jgi:hypothetical protein
MSSLRYAHWSVGRPGTWLAPVSWTPEARSTSVNAAVPRWSLKEASVTSAAVPSSILAIMDVRSSGR